MAFSISTYVPPPVLSRHLSPSGLPEWVEIYNLNDEITENTEITELQIPETAWIDAKIPSFRELSQESGKESGKESKYGGLFPLFLEGEQWPTLKKLHFCPETMKDEPLVFVAQFFDVGNPQCFWQVFMANFLADDVPSTLHNLYFGKKNTGAYIRMLTTKEIAKNKQIMIANPYGSDGPNSILPPQEIISWKSKKELDRDIVNIFANPYDDDWVDYLVDPSFWNEYGPSSELKLGGIGNSCQGYSYRSWLQNIAANKWGDSGSLHISLEKEVEGDMC